MELQDKHSKMVNAFPMAFAFSNEQFEEAKKKLGVTSNDELLTISNGGMIRKTDSKDYTNLSCDITRENDEAMKDDEYLYEGFLYELGNHEYGITYDPEPTLDCFGLTVEDFEKSKRLRTIFKKARAKYLDGFEY